MDAVSDTAPPQAFTGRFSVAPMMDWTDRHCRAFHRTLSRRALLYTEMVTTGAVLHGDRERLLGYDAVEHPVALQLGGSDPAELAAAGTLGKPVWVGLETTWLPDETLIRFRGEARAGLPAAGERDWWVVQVGDELLAVPDSHVEGLADTVDGSGLIRHWSAYVVEVPASRQTFHDLGYAALQEALDDAHARLAGHPAFAGFALHYDRPLRRLVEGTR